MFKGYLIKFLLIVALIEAFAILLGHVEHVRQLAKWIAYPGGFMIFLSLVLAPKRDRRFKTV